MRWLRLTSLGCGGLGVVLMLLLLAGFLLPSAFEAEVTRTLSAPRDVVFALVGTQRGIQRWWGHIGEKAKADGWPEMDVVAVEGPDRGPGARMAFEVGGTAAETWEILAATPPERVVYSVDFQIMVVERTLHLRAVDAHTTEVRWAESATIGNPLMRWMAWLQGDGVAENFVIALDALGEVAAADAAAGPAVPEAGDDVPPHPDGVPVGGALPDGDAVEGG